MMKPFHLEKMFAKLREDSLRTGDWARTTRVFKAHALGFHCLARLRVNLIARPSSGEGYLAGELELLLISVGGCDDASTAAALRFGAHVALFPTLVPLFDATFKAAEAQLESNAAFVALSDRAALGRALGAPKAKSARGPARL